MCEGYWGDPGPLPGSSDKGQKQNRRPEKDDNAAPKITTARPPRAARRAGKKFEFNL